MVRVVISKTRQYGWHIYIHCSAECIHRNHLVHKYWITPPKCNCTSFPQSSFFFSLYLLFRSGPPSGNLKTPEPHLETGKLFLHRWSSVQQERLNVFVVCFLNEPRSRNCWWRCGAEIVTTESLHLSLSLSAPQSRPTVQTNWRPRCMRFGNFTLHWRFVSPASVRAGFLPGLQYTLILTYCKIHDKFFLWCNVLCYFCWTDLPYMAPLLLLFILFGIVFFCVLFNYTSIHWNENELAL